MDRLVGMRVKSRRTDSVSKVLMINSKNSILKSNTF